eukprot:TRINITY_DN958_c0_g3_i1.p1 TRINITY_DN958_c0_g3~~TRINITY_DN958_c0_g3_i1.p1  ORF type:complete len:241 (+),score=103.28 TRINITY_DN958_c0_g3_i1:70-792(+)
MGKGHPFDQAIKFFDKADGRDKLYKTLQNWFKVLAWRYTVLSLTAPNAERAAARQAAQMYRSLASSLSQFRSLGKFFKWIKTAKEVQLAVEHASDMSPGDIVETVSNICDIGYKLSDNVEFLCSKKVLTGSPKEWEDRSKTFQFWAYLMAVAYGILAIAKASNATESEKSLSSEDRERAMAKRKTKLVLDFVKDFSDFLRVASGQGYLTSIPKPLQPAFAGTMGTIAGAIGTYQVWQKCA